MQQLSHPARDFDTWASAVRQQMLDSLARRRHLEQLPSDHSPPAPPLRAVDR